MKFNLICIQSHNERPSKLNIDKKLKLIQSEFENIQHHIYDTYTSFYSMLHIEKYHHNLKLLDYWPDLNFAKM